MDTLRLGQQNTMLDMVRQLRQMDQVLDRISSADVPNYEEGVFEPTVRGVTTAGTGTYSIRNGRYTRIGRLVHFELYVSWTNLTGAAGGFAVGGLPFVAANSSTFPAVTIGYAHNLAFTANNVLTAFINNNTDYVRLFQYPVGGGASTQMAIDTAGELVLQGVYTV